MVRFLGRKYDPLLPPAPEKHPNIIVDVGVLLLLFHCVLWIISIRPPGPNHHSTFTCNALEHGFITKDHFFPFSGTPVFISLSNLFYIPWPFPPAWGVTDNTKETTK